MRSRSSSASTRGTPTRAPNSPRASIAGVGWSNPNHTDSASKSKLRQTVEAGMAAEPSLILHGGARPGELAIEGERIVGAPPAGARRVDLQGACVLPAFTDAHVHFPSWALGRRELDLFGT